MWDGAAEATGRAVLGAAPLGDRAPGADADAPELDVAVRGGDAGGVALVGPGPDRRVADEQVEDAEGGDDRDRPGAGREADAPLLAASA